MATMDNRKRRLKVIRKFEILPTQGMRARRGQRIERHQPYVPLMMRVIGRPRRRGALGRSNST